MASVNIYDKISEWLSQCPYMGSYVYFNVIPLETDTSSVNTNSSSMNMTEYIDGSKEVHLMFNINLIKSYDGDGTSDLNLDAILSFDKIIEFVEEKNNEQDFPDLGESYVVSEIASSYKAPEVYITEDNRDIARYEGQFYIEYLERSK